MTDSIEINRRNWDERAIIHAGLDRLRSNEDNLHAIEAAELGDIFQKKVLHLQCHIGTDTLRLVRLGAIASGLDFSAEAIRAARRLADEAGLKADFFEGRVEEAPRLAPGPFDLVYTTWGTICWLPDLRVWAHVIATVLARGGELYFADAHPSFLIMEDRDGKLEPTHDFQTTADRPLELTRRPKPAIQLC
jgi:SAM-dependent methyltransferase